MIMCIIIHLLLTNYNLLLLLLCQMMWLCLLLDFLVIDCLLVIMYNIGGFTSNNWLEFTSNNWLGCVYSLMRHLLLMQLGWWFSGILFNYILLVSHNSILLVSYNNLLLLFMYLLLLYLFSIYMLLLLNLLWLLLLVGNIHLKVISLLPIIIMIINIINMIIDDNLMLDFLNLMFNFTIIMLGDGFMHNLVHILVSLFLWPMIYVWHLNLVLHIQNSLLLW